MSIKKLLKSFKYAFSGIVTAIKNEQNMRIHFVVGNLIIPFAYFFGISKAEWAMLVLAIGFVFFAELINTAVESLADAVTKEKNEYIKCAKDVAAGAVVISAITAICVGIALFGNAERIAETLVYIVTHIESIVIFLCLFIIDIILLFLKGKSYDGQ